MLPAKIITWRQPCHPLHLGGVGVLIREFPWGGTGQGLSQLFTQAPRPLPAASGLSISPSSHVQGSNFHRPQQRGLVRPVKDLGPDDVPRTREWLCLRSQGPATKEIILLLPIAAAWCGEQPARLPQQPGPPWAHPPFGVTLLCLQARWGGLSALRSAVPGVAWRGASTRGPPGSSTWKEPQGALRCCSSPSVDGRPRAHRVLR